MRILFLTPTLGLGGSERLTVGCASGLRARGHKVALAYGVKNLQVEATRDPEIPTFDVSPVVPDARSFAAWVANVRRVVSTFRPDVIHAQSVATAAVARAAAPGVPILFTMHGVPRESELTASLVLRLARVRATAVSYSTAAGLGRFPWSPRVELLRAGVDVERLRADSLAGGPVSLIGQPKLCCVARLAPQKGIDILLRSFALLTARYPEAGLTLVGEGEDLRRNIELARTLGVADRVVFTGGVPTAAPYMAAADAVLLASRWEGLPVVLLEALALERPIVATAVNGTPSVCVDGETGWLVPPEDAAAFGAAIEDCIEHPEEAARRAAVGRALVERDFSTEQMFDRLETLLMETSVGRHKRVPPTKPRAYYVGVRAYKSARRAAARRRLRPEWSGVRIFGYHRITPDDDVFGITPEVFAGQMETLARSGVEIVRLSDALDLLEQPIEGRYACVTFDDGYLDNLEYGLPVLETLGIPATIFVVADALEGRIVYDWYRESPPPALTVRHLPALLASGLVDIQSHSATHPRLTTVSPEELVAEVKGSKERLERHVPYTLTSFCYPAGLHTDREIQAVLAAGYRAGVTTRAGVNPGGGSLGDLRRTMIDWGDTVVDFQSKLAGYLDGASWLAESVQWRRAHGRSRRETPARTA